MARESLTLLDYSDREFLLLVADVAEDDGWSDSQALSERLDLVKRHSASSRLSWLSRWGAVEREHARDESGNLRYHRNGKAMHTQRWRLTDAGHAIAFGKLKAGQQRSLEGLRDDQLIEVTRYLSSRTRGDGTVGKLALREWKHGHGIR